MQQEPPRSPEEPNYLAIAAKSEYSLIGLATALGFAFLSGSALPLLLASGVGMVVLPLVSGSQWFQRGVRLKAAWESAEREKARRENELSDILRALPVEERTRYRELEGLAAEIRQNYQTLDSSSRILLDELVHKLEFLLGFYLRMRHSLYRYEAYFATTDAGAIRERIARLEHEMGTGPARVQQVKARTRSVLQKRLERWDKARENRALVEAQTETIEEVLRLLRDQSYQIRDPRSIASQLDTLVSSAEETERGVKDLDELLSIEQDAALGAVSLDDDDALADLAALDTTPEAPHAEPPARTAQTPRVPYSPPPPPPPPRKKLTH